MTNDKEDEKKRFKKFEDEWHPDNSQIKTIHETLEKMEKEKKEKPDGH